MIIAGLVFYLFAIVAVAAALMVITVRNPVHSVLWLVLVFFNGAGLFLLLGAEFLGMVLVVVYVGAVAVLFLFVVMMLDLNTQILREGLADYGPLGGVIGLILLAELLTVGGAWGVVPDLVTLRAAPMSAGATNTEALGSLIYTDYIYLFQVSGLVLLVAMIGSILLSHRVRAGVKKQKIAQQVTRGRTVEVKKVPTRGGV